MSESKKEEFNMKTWENHQIDGINRMPARAHFLTFPTREKA